MNHVISVKKLAEYCNPFNGCWIDLQTPITYQEIVSCLKHNKEAYTDTEFPFCKPLPKDHRERHIRKVAYFVKHGITSPISLDVGVPSLGCYIDYLVVDGNHRLAAAIYRNDETILAEVNGSIEYATELGLWNLQTC